jgi:hypothetical protein
MQSDAHMNYNENNKHEMFEDYFQRQFGIDPNMGRRRNNAEDIDPFAGLNKAQEAADKLTEIKKYYSRLYPPGIVRDIIQMCLNKYSFSFDPAVLDYDVTLASKLAKFSDTLGKLSYHGSTPVSNPFHWPSAANSSAWYVGAPAGAEVNDALKRLESFIREGNPSSFNNSGNAPSSVQPTSTPFFAEFMAQRRTQIPFQEPFHHAYQPTHDQARNISSEVEGLDSSTSSPQINTQSTTGKSAVQPSGSPRPTRKNRTDKNQVTSAKLAELETLLRKRFPTQEVERIVKECRDHARIRGHTGLLDDVLKSARMFLG